MTESNLSQLVVIHHAYAEAKTKRFASFPPRVIREFLENSPAVPERCGMRLGWNGTPFDFEGVSRLPVSYRTEDHLVGSVIPELGEGGLFVGTPLAPEWGERLIRVLEVGVVEGFEMPCIVVGNNVRSGFRAARLGMRVEYQGLDEKQRIQTERIGARASRD